MKDKRERIGIHNLPQGGMPYFGYTAPAGYLEQCQQDGIDETSYDAINYTGQ